jgi:hypothetical protein
MPNMVPGEAREISLFCEYTHLIANVATVTLDVR